MLIPNSLEDLGRFLAICPGTFWNLISHLHQNPLDLISFQPRNPPEPCLLSAPEPSRTHRDLIRYLPRNHNLISHLNWNPPEPHLRDPPEPHQPSAPEPSASSPICPGTLRNLISHLHRNPPEPSGTFSGTWCCSCTGSPQSYSGLKTP